MRARPRLLSDSGRSSPLRATLKHLWRWSRMLRVGHYVFKCADTRQEFEQIHCLNYRTFVSEIPQHPDTGTGMLVDKFHHKNSYLIVLREDRVVGMLSAHDQPPFSLADRLRDTTIVTCSGT